MAQTARELVEIGDLLRCSPKQGYWVGEVSKKLGALIADLPVALRKNGNYLFNAVGPELEISEVGEGITAFRITESTAIDLIENCEQGTRIMLSKPLSLDERGKKVSSLLLRTRPASLPATAISLESLTAPVELLDEYAAITQKLKGKSGTTQDHVRRGELISLIGSEYERRKNAQITSSRRSTPETSGESRGISSYRGG